MKKKKKKIILNTKYIKINISILSAQKPGFFQLFC